MAKNHWRNIHASLLRFCSDMQDELRLSGFDVQIVNLDDFTDESQWPEGDFLGISNVHVEIFETYEVKLMFAISTTSDRNMFRMAKIAEVLLERLIPNENIPVYDATTGAQIGWFFVQNGVSIGAPVVTKTQPVRPIMVRLLSDLTSV